MLDGHIEIAEDFAALRNGLQELRVDSFRIHIHQADPFYSLNPFQVSQEFMEDWFAVEVRAIHGGVLGDDDQFGHPGFRQFFGFFGGAEKLAAITSLK